jgi:hypothetical protein
MSASEELARGLERLLVANSGHSAVPRCGGRRLRENRARIMLRRDWRRGQGLFAPAEPVSSDGLAAAGKPQNIANFQPPEAERLKTKNVAGGASRNRTTERGSIIPPSQVVALPQREVQSEEGRAAREAFRYAPVAMASSRPEAIWSRRSPKFGRNVH